jgi:hypothetical protein
MIPTNSLGRSWSGRWMSTLPRVFAAALLGAQILGGSACGRSQDPSVKITGNVKPLPGAEGSGPVLKERASGNAGHARMVALLREIAGRTDDENYWIGDREARGLREKLAGMPADAPTEDRWKTQAMLGIRESWLGNFDVATEHLSQAHKLLPKIEAQVPQELLYQFFLGAGLVWLRLGEVQNCCARHSSESCILPLRGEAIHVNQVASRRAITYFGELARRFPSRQTPRWLLNIAYMTIDGYPKDVPPQYLIPPKVFESEEAFPRFVNIASQVGLDVFSLAGSIIVDDFDNDGFLDVVVSSWDPRVQLRFFHNNGDGTFSDRTREAGLTGILGGANLVQTDYNNDGFLDILVLRGTWLGKEGRHPLSLLRNNRDGTFTDVTFDAGLGKVFYPTETAAWADYDNDGWLDLYVGNESGDGLVAPCQLFHNNRDGTFTDMAPQAGVENFRFTKGVSWGDYDGDGFPDLYVANLRKGGNRLYHNNRDGTFTDVAPELGVTRPSSSYACWFWDFDNDGSLDLYVASYAGGIEAVAAGYLGAPLPPEAELGCLYRGNGRGGFAEVAVEYGLKRPTMAMGANFGDLDNDGYLDFYLGTGYPEYEALMPKVMYHNKGGRGFADVTFAGGFGHLQKGHGVAFADFDNDGTQDVFEQMGGAFRGDGAYFALYRNPGFGNHWIKLKLVGVKTNRAAIGAQIRLDINDGKPRSIYRHVGSGGSFGANPLRQITWPTSGLTQTFRRVPVDQILEIREGSDELRVLSAAPRK